MKILWLCNTLISSVGKELGLSFKAESWIEGMYEKIKEREEISLTYLFPADTNALEYCVENRLFLSYEEHDRERLDTLQVARFKEILKEQKPDVIHIFGTEASHSYAMALAAAEMKMNEKVLLNIQGLSGFIAKHYTCFLPERVIKRWSLRDLIRRDNIYYGQQSFYARGRLERKTFELASHVVGRTDWDRACAKLMNPEICYHHGNETLRPSFYMDRWNKDKCIPHSIFMTQWYGPFKGLHLLIEAVAILKREYPDISIYTTGDDLLNRSFKGRLKMSYYHQYLRKLIVRNELTESIHFLGRLSEEEMKERYLLSNVVVCSSSIENSSNSVGEAMKLGVPIVASDVGGIKSLMTHGKEGLLYQADAPYMMADSIARIFREDIDLKAMSEAERERSEELYNPEENFTQLMTIYKEVMQ